MEHGTGGVAVWAASRSAAHQRRRSVMLPLAPFAGKTISVSFSFDTLDDTMNDGEGVCLDSGLISSGC